MDFITPSPSYVSLGEPVFMSEAAQLAGAIQQLDDARLQAVMKVSLAITAATKQLYQNWRPEGEKAAFWAYKGDVYKGVKATTLTRADAQWAQDHIVTMSGLYGIVRPFDAIAGYRLEMRASLPVAGAKDIYEFWGQKLARYVQNHAQGVVCVLSSDEYARPVTRHLPQSVRVVTPMFYDEKPNGTVGVVPIYSKMMRGVMARWMIDHRVETPEDLKQFTGHGYSYDSLRSTQDQPAFYRAVMKPLVF